MKFTKLKLALIIFFNILLFIIALPRFNFSVGENTLTFPQINLSMLGIDSELGSFRKSFGFFETEKVQLQLSGEILDENTLNNVVNTVAKRIEISEMYDVKVAGLYKNNDFFIEIEYPNYYSNKEEISKLLLNDPSISFIEFSAFTQEGQNLQSGSINLKYLNNVTISNSLIAPFSNQQGQIYSQPTLVFNFSNEAADDISLIQSLYINSASTEEGQQYSLSTVAALGDYQISFIPHPSNTNILQGVVNFSNQNLEDDYQFFVKSAQIIASYFGEKEQMNVSAEVVGTESVASYIAIEGKSVLVVGILLLILLVVLVILRKYKISKAMQFTLNFSTIFLLVFNLLKLGHANLSAATYLGLIFTILICLLISFELMIKETKEQQNKFNARVKFSSITLFAISLLTYKVLFNMPFFSDFNGVLIALSVILISLSYVEFFHISEIIKKSLKNE